MVIETPAYEDDDVSVYVNYAGGYVYVLRMAGS